ncbi:MAG TPA: EAL domain-containing protein [Spirochaetota bacterium]|nr:EAL domain-containing protein [Spirochaetota bacterium]
MLDTARSVIYIIWSVQQPFSHLGDIMAVIKSVISSFIKKISSTLVMRSIRQGLTLMIPVMMIGSFALFFNNIPVDAYQEFMLGLFGPGWENLGIYIHRGTFAIMAAGMLLTISHSMAVNSIKARNHHVNPATASIISLASFFSLMHIQEGFLKFSCMGPLGVFIAIIVACTATPLFIFFSSVPKLKLRMYSNAADQTLTQSISALFPALATVSIFALLHLLLALSGIEDLHEAMNSGLQDLFSGMSSSLFTAVIFISLIHIFWFFGIHGSNVLEPVTQSLFVPALEVNRNLFLKGLNPTEIFTKQFFDVFVLLGGSGATLCLIIALLAGTRRSNTKQIAVISTPPALINVNEIMIFGVPVILNFYLLIPFIILPVILTLITYTAMSLGLVPLTIASVEWTTPVIIGGYTATGSFAGSLLQIFNLIVGVIVYLPFIRMHEKGLEKGQEELMNSLLKEVQHLDEKKELILLNRNDNIGNLARLLSSDLERDLNSGRISLVYQPQVNSDNRMFGMEALLRWKHNDFGPIPPPVTIALAEESPFIYDLGTWIIRTACMQMNIWNRAGLKNFSMSINLSPYQLDDPSLISKVKSILDTTGVKPSSLEIEITEQAALGGLERLGRLNELKGLGIKLAMDDFGMGHSSLMYLKELSLDTIKLDGALVHEVLTNEKCGEIISSIIQLGRSMNINVIAEYVDTEPQQRELVRLGCHLFQGFLYSPPLQPDELRAYYHSLEEAAESMSAL